MSAAGFWTPERDAVLKACASSGASAADAARALDCSRGAAKERARRIGAPFNARAGTRAKTRTTAFKRARRGKAQAWAPVPFLETTQAHCRFPIGDDWTSRQMCCGGPRKPGSSYCDAHHKRTHRRARGDGDMLADHVKHAEALATQNRMDAAADDSAFLAGFLSEHMKGSPDDPAED